MNKGYAISKEVLDLCVMALTEGKHWMAYNCSLYFINKEDVFFFDSQKEANNFARDNISDRDNFNIIRVNSINDISRRIQYDIQTDPDINGLYYPDGNAFTDALIDHIEEQQLLNNKNINIMNEKNLDYLKDNLKFMGFGDKLNGDLEAKIREGKPDFQLKLSEAMYQGKMETTLNFRQSPATEMYFFNSYEARLSKENAPDLSQQFYVNNGKGVTLKEAYNLLEGRSVLKELANKEGEKYHAWVKLDFSKKEGNNFDLHQYGERYGYDLMKEVGKLNLAPVPEEKEKQLMQSLQKGNLQAVNFMKDGKVTPMFIEANPQFKAVNIYDPAGHQLNKIEREPYLKQGGQSLDTTPGLKEDKSLSKENEKDLSKGHEKKSEANLNGKQHSKAEKKSTGRDHADKKSKDIKGLLPQKQGSSKKTLRV